MLVFDTFAVICVLSLIALVIYLFPSSKNPSTIPGLDPISKEDGNLGDIAKLGSLHEFLVDLHKKFGPIASFWWGPKYVVSIANDALFKEHHTGFDRPVNLFQIYEPLLGAKSIVYANGKDGRTRRKLYEKCLTHDAIKKYFLTFQESSVFKRLKAFAVRYLKSVVVENNSVYTLGNEENLFIRHCLPISFNPIDQSEALLDDKVSPVANELAKKCENMVKGEHVPVTQFMMEFALKVVLASLFGERMKSDKKVLEFREIYDVVWTELEDSLKEPMSEASLKKVIDGTKKMSVVIKEMFEHRKTDPLQHGEELLLDLVLDYTDDVEIRTSDVITFVIGGFQTTGYMLSWCCYYLATRGDIQENIYREIKTVLGNEDVDHTNISDLVYLRQVMDETLRCALIAPWAARIKDYDSELGGHKIPKDTPVIHALGVANKDEEVFPLPDNFDPDRFSSENKRGRSHFAFSPFGFAGKRACPGQHFAYAEGTVALVTLLRKFKVNIVEGQNIEYVYGLVTHPSDEIWITLSKR